MRPFVKLEISVERNTLGWWGYRVEANDGEIVAQWPEATFKTAFEAAQEALLQLADYAVGSALRAIEEREERERSAE